MTAKTGTAPVNSGGHAWLIPLVLSTLGALPLLGVHFQQLWSRPHYQYFPFVLMSILLIALLRKTDPERTMPRPRPALAVLSLLVGWSLMVVATLKISPLLCCLGWWISLAGAVWIAPWPAWGAWALVGLLLRLPNGLDVAWIQWLQHSTTTLSSSFLDRLGVDHLQEGNVLVFPERRLFVEEACSGVVSLFTIVATAGILGAFMRRTFAHTLCLMATAGFWAGVANVVRIVVMSYCLDRLGLDLTAGTRHTMLGVGVFVVTLLMLASTDALLRFLLGPIDVNDFEASEGVLNNRLVRCWNFFFSPGSSIDPLFRPKGRVFQSHLGWELAISVIGIAFVGLFAMQIWGGIGPFENHLAVKPAVEAIQSDSLPANLVGWTRTDFQTEVRDASSQFGHKSHQWTYTRGPLKAVLSIDYPFPEWHSLQACYAGVGWEVRPLPQPGEATTRRAFALTKGTENGTLIFDLADQHGQPYVAPAGASIHPRWRRLLSGDSTPWTLPSFYQMQLLAIHDRRLTPEEFMQFSEAFNAFRGTVQELILTQSAAVAAPAPAITEGGVQ